ncbi:tetratricopeptide repeat protein [Oxalobacteraceae bacterium A2-2]
MKTLTRYAPALACAMLLSACATDGALVRNDKPAAPPLERSLADADTAIAAGQADKAQAMLKAAAASYPADKAPWLRLAQLKFDQNNYGDAIGNALEALQRDPVDKLGNSIVAVSGLRLSTRALSDLSQQNNLNGPLRSEAQELARVLRSALGEEVLVPPAAPNRKPASPARKAAATASNPVPARPNAQAGTDPFGGLK